MMEDAELIARLRGWAKDIQEGSEAIWAMDQDLKGAADRIEALIAERDAARDAALEEAAHIVDAFLANTPCYIRVDALRGGCSPSAAIRSLKGKSHE